MILRKECLSAGDNTTQFSSLDSMTPLRIEALGESIDFGSNSITMVARAFDSYHPLRRKIRSTPRTPKFARFFCVALSKRWTAFSQGDRGSDKLTPSIP